MSVADVNLVVGKMIGEFVAPINEVTLNILDSDFKTSALKLSVAIDIAAKGLKELAIKELVCKQEYKEAYNNAYMNPPVMNKAKPTVAELTAYAENVTAEKKMELESITIAYDALKSQINTAQSILNTLRDLIDMDVTSTHQRLVE